MKKGLLLTATAFCLLTADAQAQMGGHEGAMDKKHPAGGTMDSHQSSQMMSGQMMTYGMMREVAGTMNRMGGIIQRMSQPAGGRMGMDQARMKDMSKMMDEMSVLMHDMAGLMGKGAMDPAMTQKMHERLKTINQMMEGMQKAGK